MPDSALRISGLGHAYDAGRWVFRGCEVEVGRGEILAILGPNGSGKSTLLKLVLGLLHPTEGAIAVSGQAAFIPQLFQVAFDFSALDMVLMGRARTVGLFSQPSRADRRAALDLLERLDLAGLADRPFHDLSGGERQLVIVARALLSDPDIILMDEPTSALDLHNQAVLLERMARLADEAGHTVVFTTHNPQHALAISDQALLLGVQGSPLSGPTEQLLIEDNLSAVYGLPIRRMKGSGDQVDGFSPLLRKRVSARTNGEGGVSPSYSDEVSA